MRMPSFPAGACLLSVLVACGGGGGGPKAKLPVTISLSPHALLLTAGTTFDFSFGLVIPGGNAQTDFGYTWSASGGSISQAGQLPSPYEDGGHYTAPATPGTYTVAITSQYDTSMKDTATVTVIPAPAIASFGADTQDLDALDPKAALTPVFSGGTGSISPEVGACTSGTPVTVRPSSDRTYTLTVTNAAGTTLTRTLGLKLWGVPTVDLSAQAARITQGETGSLAWSFNGATTAFLAPLPGALPAGPWISGSMTIAPLADTTYTLTVTNPVHTSAASVTVRMVAAPAIQGFDLAPEVIHPGERAHITGVWTGGTASVTPAIGTFSPGSPVELGPDTTTAYTLTVANAVNATATAQRTLRVAAAGAFSQSSFLATPRVNPLLAPLPGGKVLVAGGGSPDLNAQGQRTPLASAEIFDPATGASRALSANLASGRFATRAAACTAILPGGGVLVMPTAYDGIPEIFEPATETFRPLRTTPPSNTYVDPYQSLALPDGRILFTTVNRLYAFDPAGETFQEIPLKRNRFGHALTLLGDGTVLVSGGDPVSYPQTGTTCERYDPASGATTLLPGQWPGPRRDHQAFLGAGGRVEIWGGQGQTPGNYWGTLQQVASVDPADGSLTTTGLPILGLPAAGPYAIARLGDARTLLLQTRSGSLYDPAAQRVLPAENDAVLWHHGTANPSPFPVASVALPDGRVLVAGGEAEDARRITLFDPAATYASPYSGLRSTPIYAYADLAPLADGRVLVLDSSGRKAPRLLDPATGGTIAAGTLAQRASYLAVVAVPDGSALAFGGNLYADNSNASTVLDLVQRFDGTTWSLAGRLLATRGKPTVLRLDDGRCLVLGGNISAGAPWGECFDPGSGTSKALPAPPQAFDSWFGAGMVAGGRVLVAGSGRAFLFDPATFTWSATAIAIDATAPSFVLGLSGGGALLLKDVKSQTLDLASGLCAAYPSALDYIALALPLKDGRILVKGWLQVDSSTSLDALAVLDPAKGTSRLLPAAHAVVKAMVQLADGRIFLVHDGSGSSEFLDPARM